MWKLEGETRHFGIRPKLESLCETQLLVTESIASRTKVAPRIKTSLPQEQQAYCDTRLTTFPQHTYLEIGLVAQGGTNILCAFEAVSLTPCA